MPGKIGATIALDGEKEFRQAVKSANSEMKLLQSELRQASARFSENANSMKAYTAKQELLTKQVETQKEKIDTLKAALEHAKKTYGENSNEVKHWQTQLNNAETDLGKMNKELEETKKHTSGIGKLKTEFGEAKEKIEDAKEKLENFQKVASGIGKAMKAGIAVGTAALAEIGTMAVAVGKQIWNMAGEVSETGDAIQKTSQKVGMSYEAYQKWDYAMKIAGTEMSSCTTGLKTLTNTFDDAQNGSAGAAEKFSRLGLSMDDLKGKSREEVFAETVSALQGVQDETEKAALANDMFGKSGQDLIPLFNMSQEELQGLMDDAERYGMVMSDETVEASAAFKDSLTTLKGTMTGLKNELVGQLLPGLSGLTDGLTELISGNPEEGIEMISGAVSELLDVIETMLPTVLELGGSILQSLAEAILQSTPELVETGMPILMSIMTSIIDNLSVLIDAALQILQYLMDGLQNNSSMLATTAIALVKQLLLGLLQMLPQLLEVGIELVVALVEGLSDPGMLAQIIEAALTCAGKLVEGLIRSIPKVLSAGIELVKGLWQGISDSLGWLKGKITGWVGNVMDFLKGLFGIHSPSAVMRDVIGKNLMLGLGAGIDAYGNIPLEAMDAMTASLTNVGALRYTVDGVYDQIAASQPTAYTYSGGGGTGTQGGGTPLETVIALLQVIAANSNKQIVLSDGTLLGWLNAALGQSADDSERGMAI